MNIKDYRELCIKYVTGNINSNEEQIFKSWLAESESNTNEYNKIKNIWASTAPNMVAQIPDVDDEWNKLRMRIEVVRNQNDVKDSILSKIYSNVKLFLTVKWKPAAGLAFGISLLLIGIFLLNRESIDPPIQTVTTFNKEHKLIQLSDGSTVLLNSNSSLSYFQTFKGNAREVSLTGEAFFSVTKDTRPFIIMTSNAKTTVLGTKFDVWARGEKTKVFVKEGRVNLTKRIEGSNGVDLVKNQLSVLTNDLKPTAPKEVEPAYLLGWIDNKLVFDHTPLIEIVDELESYYDINLSLSSENLKSYTLTGSFRNNDVDSTLTMICLALGVNFEKQNDGYVIKAGPMKRGFD